MTIAVADLSHLAGNSVAAPGKAIGVLVVHECPLFRVGLCSFLGQQSDCRLIGEAIQPKDVLLLIREQRPDVVLLDGSLTTTDPLDLVQQLRQQGVPGILVFAPPMGDEETLFRFLMYGVTAYEDSTISGEDLLVTIRRVAQGECLITGDDLLSQAARRERLAHIRRNALLVTRNDAHCLSRQVENCQGTKTQESLCSISERDQAILERIARGGTNAQVAQALGIGPHIVKNRLDQLFKKLNIHDRTSAVIMALRNQWITLDGIHSLSL